MIPIEVDSPTWRRKHFNEEANREGLVVDADLIEEMRTIARVRELTLKQRMAKCFDSKVRPRNFRIGDLVLKKVIVSKQKGKLAPNWEGPYRIKEVLNNGAYKIENIE